MFVSLLFAVLFTFSIDLADFYKCPLSATFLGELADLRAFLASLSFFRGDFTGDWARLSLRRFN